jgi:putative spermidine/putrescine transport system ATP-binding protein
MIEPADFELASVTKRYGSIIAVDAIDLKIPKGAYCCVLGASGCGKTTMLHMIAGHEGVSGGDIVLGTRIVNDMPPAHRSSGYRGRRLPAVQGLALLEG